MEPQAVMTDKSSIGQLQGLLQRELVSNRRGMWVADKEPEILGAEKHPSVDTSFYYELYFIAI